MNFPESSSAIEMFLLVQHIHSSRIFNMRSEKIEERTTFLLQFLDLPRKWRQIMNLSGGQQRYIYYPWSSSYTCPGSGDKS